MSDIYQGVTVFGLNDLVTGNSAIGQTGVLSANLASVQVAGSDGTDLRTLRTDNTGALYVVASIAPPSDSISTGTLTNPGDTVFVSTTGTSALMLQLTGAITGGTVQFQVSLDGTTWQPVSLYPAIPNGSPAASSTATSPSNWTLPVGGVQKFRVLASGGFVGPVSVTETAGQGQYGVFNYSDNAANFLATVSQGTSPWVVNTTQVAGVTLGATAVTAFGTAPAAANVMGTNSSIYAGTTPLTATGSSLNTNVTNTVTVTGTVAVSSVSGTVAVTQSTSPWVVAGNLTHNNAAPIADNVGVLSALANAAPPTFTEGNQVLLSVDLAGNLRTTSTITGTPNINVAQWNGVAVSSPTAWGTAPTGNVIGVNAEMFAGNTPLTATAGALNVNISSTTGGTLTVAGNLTNNNAAPAATNIGVLPAIVASAPETYTAGFQALPAISKGGSTVVVPADEQWASSLNYFSADNGAVQLPVSVAATYNVASVATSVGSTAVYTGVFTTIPAVGTWVVITGFVVNPTNNGTFQVAVGSTSTTLVLSNAAAVAETQASFATTTGSPVFSIRTSNAAIIYLLRGVEFFSGGQLGYYRIIKNGTLTGAAFGAGPSANMSVDTSAYLITGGSIVDSGYTGVNHFYKDLLRSIAAGAPGDIFTLYAQAFSGTSKVNGSLQWSEQTASL